MTRRRRDRDGRAGIRALAIAGVCFAAGAVATVSGCDSPAERSELQTTVDYFLQASPGDRTSKREFLEDLENGADRRIRAALAGDALTAEVADRLVAAQDRGVRVEVVTDGDEQSSEPVQTLLDNDIPVTFGDGELDYVPDPSLTQLLSQCERQSDRERVLCGPDVAAGDPCGGSQGTTSGIMCRPGSYNVMSHRFVLIDQATVWHLAGGLENDDGGPLAWRVESEIIHEDFTREFRQLSAGTFATTLDAYNGPLKSTGDNNLDYMTDRGVVQMRFNPQERLLKHVIDEVYRARSSIAIATPSLRNPFLLDALEYKADNGFEVSIIVGNRQPRGPARGRLQDLDARTYSGDRQLPTVVAVDTGGSRWPRTAMILTHPLIHSQPYAVEQGKQCDEANQDDTSQCTVVYPSDKFADGSMWKFYEYSSNAGGEERTTDEIDRLESVIDRTFSNADPL